MNLLPTRRRGMPPGALLLAASLLAAPPLLGTEDGQQPQRHVYTRAGERDLHAFVFNPANHRADRRTAAILLFHGGGWTVGSPEWTFGSARRYASLGLVAISVEYRLSHDDLTPIDALADACAAFRWARRNAAQLGIDPQRVAGHGVSAGGQLVAGTATVGCPAVEGDSTDSVPDALLLWSPAVDVTSDGWFGKLLRGRGPAADYSPAEHVRPGGPPTVIVQGARDSVTPLSGAQKYCERQQRVGGTCELHGYDGLGHLLTRNLTEQENDFDVDPAARADGIRKQERFLRELGFVPQPAPR